MAKYYEAIKQPKGTATIESYSGDTNTHIETVLRGIKPQTMATKIALSLNDAFNDGCRCAYDKLLPEIERQKGEMQKCLSVIEAYKAQHETDKIEKTLLNKRIEDLELRLEYHRKTA